MRNEIVIEFNEENRKKFLKKYFAIHPKAKNEPIKSCVHPSLNTWQNMHYAAKNTLKQNWKDYVSMVVEELGYKDLNIDRCEIHVHIVKPTRVKFDLDNTSIKFIQDSLVHNKVIIEDNYTVLSKLTYTGEYQKGISKMILTIRY